MLAAARPQLGHHPLLPRPRAGSERHGGGLHPSEARHQGAPGSPKPERRAALQSDGREHRPLVRGPGAAVLQGHGAGERGQHRCLRRRCIG